MRPSEFTATAIPPECIDLIRRWESLELIAYPDPTGIPSIGYGHTRGVTKADITNRRSITRQEAENLLLQDIEEAVSILRNSVAVDLNPYQLGALASFVYNVGGGRKASSGDPGKDGFVVLKNGSPSTLRRKVNAGDFAGAALEFHKWVHAGGKRLNGLVSRRAEEAALFCRDASGVPMTDHQPVPQSPPQPQTYPPSYPSQPYPPPYQPPPQPPYYPPYYPSNSQTPPLVDQPSGKPTRKWTMGAIGGGVAGALTFMVVVFWNTKFPEDQIPAEYVTAISSLFTYIGVLATQYMVRNRATDIPPN